MDKPGGALPSPDHTISLGDTTSSPTAKEAAMQDHDQRFKVLLHEFIVEFFLLFYPEWARRFDFARIEWLDQEVFPDPPQGARYALDLVAKLPVLEPVTMPGRDPAESLLALVHIEVESREKVTTSRPRM